MCVARQRDSSQPLVHSPKLRQSVESGPGLEADTQSRSAVSVAGIQLNHHLLPSGMLRNGSWSGMEAKSGPGAPPWSGAAQAVTQHL